MTFVISMPSALLEATYRGFASSSSASSPTTFSSQPFGPADPDRYILVLCGAQASHSCTIGGVSATSVVSSIAGSGIRLIGWVAPVPTGTTGAVVITGANAYPGIQIYSLVPVASGTPGDTETTSGNSITVPDTGYAIGGCFDASVGAAPTITLGGLVEEATDTWSVTVSVCRLTVGKSGPAVGSLTVSRTSTGSNTTFAVVSYGIS